MCPQHRATIPLGQQLIGMRSSCLPYVGDRLFRFIWFSILPIVMHLIVPPIYNIHLTCLSIWALGTVCSEPGCWRHGSSGLTTHNSSKARWHWFWLDAPLRTKQSQNQRSHNFLWPLQLLKWSHLAYTPDTKKWGKPPLFHLLSLKIIIKGREVIMHPKGDIVV